MFLDDDEGRWAIFRLLPNDGDTAEVWEQHPPLAPDSRYSSLGPSETQIGEAYGPGRYMVIAPEENYGQRRIITIDIVEIVSYGAAPAPDPEPEPPIDTSGLPPIEDVLGDIDREALATGDPERDA